MKKLISGMLLTLALAIPAFSQFTRSVQMDSNYVIVDLDQIAPSNNIATNAASCSYDNPTYTTVKAALDSLLYVSPTVTLSGGTTYDIGRVITNVGLTFLCSKTMTDRDISGGSTNVSLGAGGSGSYTVTNALKSTQTTYTMTVTDGVATNSGTTTLYFRNRKYWGFNNVTNSIDDSGILALANSALATSKAITATGLTPSGDQYIWVCYPASFGAASFTLGGLPSTGWPVETNDFVNAYGYTNSYLRYRSVNVYSVPVNLVVY